MVGENECKLDGFCCHNWEMVVRNLLGSKSIMVSFGLWD